MSENELPLCTSDLEQEVKIRLGENGFAALPPRTIMECFDVAVHRFHNLPALFQKKPVEGTTIEDTPWTIWTWREYRNNVNAFGKSLLSLGFNRFDVVNIIGFNSPEWFFANFGAIAAGGVAAGIYATNNPESCKYVAEHSKAKVIVCDGLKQLEKFYKISEELPNLKALVMYGQDELPGDIKSLCSVPVYTFSDFIKLGQNVRLDDLKIRSESWRPGETCELIYTSGTTGPPKAVMITNDNCVWTASVVISAATPRKVDHNDVMVSYLPLSHIAAQMLDLFQPLLTGCKMYFAQPDALKGSLVNTLKDVRPTIFFGVPRVWEKIYDKMQEVAKSVTGVKKVISTWAKQESGAYWDCLDFDSMQQFDLRRIAPVGYFMSQGLLSAVRQKLGFDRCCAFYVSAAPIEVKILKYFASVDIPIMELFGQSECTGPHAINTYSAFKIGTVGRPLLGTETMLVEDTGELCYRGRHIFAGYLGMPDKTTETIDSEGWLHSGDIASMDENNDERIPGKSGFITITGRIKELIITAGGENVPPVLIENELKNAMPALSNAMVIGDKRKFLTVILCLHVEIDSEGVPSNKLDGAALGTAKEIDSTAKTTEDVRDDPKWREYFERGIEKANEKATSRAQRVAKWSLLETDFSEKGSELTPTLKLKRSVTADKYSAIIEAMYS